MIFFLSVFKRQVWKGPVKGVWLLKGAWFVKINTFFFQVKYGPFPKCAHFIMRATIGFYLFILRGDYTMLPTRHDTSVNVTKPIAEQERAVTSQPP